MNAIELTQEIVRELLHYVPQTGLLYWKERDIKWFENGTYNKERKCAAWNAKNSGKLAFTSNSYGYLVGAIFTQIYKAHRIIWLWMTGEWPKGEVDHKNGIRNDNRWENLQDATRSQNQRNSGWQINNTSGRKGVSWSKAYSVWYARVWDGTRLLHLGTFHCKEEAYQAYVDAGKALGYSDRHLGIAS